jgi:hypothetical protein
LIATFDNKRKHIGLTIFISKNLKQLFENSVNCNRRITQHLTNDQT